MQVTYSWIIYSCLIFGTGTLCDRKIVRRQAVSSRPEHTDDAFNCLYYERTVQWPLVCDGYDHCFDGSDESKELCALYKFETNMTMDCGRVHNMKNQVTAEEVDQSIIELAPWTVAVYGTSSISKFSFLYTGSMIAPNIVITWGQLIWHVRNDDEYLKIGPMLKWLDDYKLLMNVTRIYMNKDFTTDISNLHNSIAVIVLENRLPLSNVFGFKPICIDWLSKYDNIRKETQMRIIGFNGSLGNRRGDQKVIKVTQYFNNYRPTTDDTFRIKFNTDTHLEYGFQGSGLGISNSNTYYLTGIMKGFTRRNRNSSMEVDTIEFINIKNDVPWIRGILIKHATVNSCVLPIAEGVIYSYEDSNKILSHGILIDRRINVVEDCEVGYHKAYPYGLRSCLGKGKWLANPHKLCSKMCRPLESDSLDIQCQHDGKYANCSNLSIPNTTAKPFCKPSFTPPNGQTHELPELVCQSNGIWDKQLYECKPACGKVYNMSDVLIFNGKKAALGTAPWNVGVYQFNNISFNYDLICGGSIISPNLVVSAAHCFWNFGMPKEIKINDGRYKIAVGKYDRIFTINDNEFTKIINVDIVYVHKHYYGLSGFHYGDIAIILLQNRVSFSSFVAPVCIDWNRLYNEINGDQGKIVGWGKTEKNVSSHILLEASMPYLDFSSCRNVFTDGFESFVTPDKFCAGSADLLVSEQTLGHGDSGAGISFLHNRSYYLTGVTSVKDRKANNSIVVFTEVKFYIEWIRELRDNLSSI